MKVHNSTRNVGPGSMGGTELSGTKLQLPHCLCHTSPNAQSKLDPALWGSKEKGQCWLHTRQLFFLWDFNRSTNRARDCDSPSPTPLAPNLKGKESETPLIAIVFTVSHFAKFHSWCLCDLCRAWAMATAMTTCMPPNLNSTTSPLSESEQGFAVHMLAPIKCLLEAGLSEALCNGGRMTVSSRPGACYPQTPSLTSCYTRDTASEVKSQASE